MYNGTKHGSHAAVWVSSGGSSRGSSGGSWLYDPAGSYGGADRPTNDVFDEVWAADTGSTYTPKDFTT